MSKKVFEVRIDVVSTSWDSCEAYVEAETAAEARELFENDPDSYDWDNWKTHDTETRNWEIDTVEYDEYLTKRLQEKEKTTDPLLENITERLKANDIND